MDLTQEIKGEWAAMSRKERIAATDSVVGEMVKLREERKYAAHNTAIAGFHDTRVTIEKIADLVRGRILL